MRISVSYYLVSFKLRVPIIITFIIVGKAALPTNHMKPSYQLASPAGLYPSQVAWMI